MTKKTHSGRMTLDKPKIDLRLQNNFELLDSRKTKIHLETLSRMLLLLSRLIYEKIPEHGGKNPGFQQYLIRLGQTLDSILLKNRIDTLTGSQSIIRECSIDPSESGFPVILRDFFYLEKDKQNAPEVLKRLPDDQTLVNEAEFSLFRGVFPHDILRAKYERNYYRQLAELELPRSLRIFPDEYLEEQDGSHYLIKTVEKLDENNNLPRFYTLHIKVPRQSFNSVKWRQELDPAIQKGLATLADYELRFLPPLVEKIEGIQLQMVERFDIGPFYNVYTSNRKSIQRLLEHASESDAVLAYRKSYTARLEEKRKPGFKAFVKGLFSGDTHEGIFSPVINSPRFMLMPHRLIQRAYNLGLDFEEEVKLLGINESGEFSG